jgi:hypothetical protein
MRVPRVEWNPAKQIGRSLRRVKQFRAIPKAAMGWGTYGRIQRREKRDLQGV